MRYNIPLAIRTASQQALYRRLQPPAHEGPTLGVQTE